VILGNNVTVDIKNYKAEFASRFKTALHIYSIPIAITMKPTSLETAFIPDAPRNLTINLLLDSIRQILVAVASIASKTILRDSALTYSCSMLISSDIDPGPAIMGIASGVSDIESRLNASSLTRLSIPLCLVNLPVRSANPDETIIIPPAMRKDSKEMPKKERIYFPAKKLINKITPTLRPVSSAVFVCWAVVFSLVRPTKIGTVPNGFVIEKREPKDKRNMSNIVFSF